MQNALPNGPHYCKCDFCLFLRLKMIVCGNGQHMPTEPDWRNLFYASSINRFIIESKLATLREPRKYEWRPSNITFLRYYANATSVYTVHKWKKWIRVCIIFICFTLKTAPQLFRETARAIFVVLFIGRLGSFYDIATRVWKSPTYKSVQVTFSKLIHRPRWKLILYRPLMSLWNVWNPHMVNLDFILKETSKKEKGGAALVVVKVNKVTVQHSLLKGCNVT